MTKFKVKLIVFNFQKKIFCGDNTINIIMYI